MPRLNRKKGKTSPKSPIPGLDLSHIDTEELEMIAASTLGDNIERLISDRTSPLSMLLARAATQYSSALLAFLDVPLQTAEGLEQAIHLQAEARRYRDMCQWLKDGLTDAEYADDAMAGEVEDEAVEELKDQLNGKRDKHSYDA